MTKLTKLFLILLFGCLFIVITACSNSDTTIDDNSSSEKDKEPFGKYDPAIDVSFVRSIDSTLDLALVDGETIEDNVWLDYYRDELGINVTYDWTASAGDQFDQKMNVSLASGDIPDFVSVNATQLNQLVKADMIMELTDLYEDYVAPFAKEVLESDGSGPFDAATIDGQLWGLPNMSSSIDGAEFVWVRTDWLEKLGLPEPKTMDDLLAISEAFTTQDPDGNGKDDTTGLAVTKDLWDGYAGLKGFFNGFHAYPNIWIKDASGEIVYGSIQPEVKEALQTLQDMFGSGQIDREFGVKPGDKVAEDPAAGRNGLHFGQQWTSLWPLQANRDNDPNAQWKAYPLVSVDDQPARPQITLGTTSWWVVRKDVEHEEAIVKMFNGFIEKNWGETAEFDKYYMPDGAEGTWKLSPPTPSPPNKNLDAFLAIREAVGNDTTDQLEGEAKVINGRVSAFEDGDDSLWGWERIYGPEEGVFGIMDEYVNQDLFMRDEFNGAPTPTMAEKNATLEQLQNEVFTKIILGDADIDEFDKFVEDWKSLGGEQITQEVNEWYQNVN
ncbi:extracellular solute-binding protein [Gracilibacillus alcaliphilus]|uniref:extracellular solute-binding protein n=1 Tax=Gracilibacillus alcaliphilus TaxID=1401441 RepID=UPI001EF87A7B|nr:extracellular solute-binding protein [Gracilibacillus alcaliphilus]MBM7678128.1 putative aldouronate transport system substrate-binding protein [Gracilibacillus alcaliphilus]